VAGCPGDALSRKRAWRQAAAVSAVAITLVGGGYGFAKWQDHDANDGIGRCVASRLVAVNSGMSVCPLAAVVPGWKDKAVPGR
jgi:hypothetical protein